MGVSTTPKSQGNTGAVHTVCETFESGLELDCELLRTGNDVQVMKTGWSSRKRTQRVGPCVTRCVAAVRSKMSTERTTMAICASGRVEGGRTARLTSLPWTSLLLTARLALQTLE